jgi:hypothetical protein
MINQLSTIRKQRWPARRAAHLGTTTLELLVAFTLLSTVLTASLPLVVRHQRILATARHYRLALDELSNQLERLTALSAADVPEELERLEPSAFTAERLSGAELTGMFEPADLGQRLTLQLVWDEPQRREAPASLAAWIPPDEMAGRAPSEQTTEANQP